MEKYKKSEKKKIKNFQQISFSPTIRSSKFKSFWLQVVYNLYTLFLVGCMNVRIFILFAILFTCFVDDRNNSIVMHIFLFYSFRTSFMTYIYAA